MGKDIDLRLGPRAWRTRPIFVSGTFRDMHVERDALTTAVFPALQEALLPLRTHLERVDLRVGVETKSLEGEHSKQMLVLQVCLDEVKRSRPFLVILLGDRYGWVPPTERMNKAVQEAGYEADTEGKSMTALEVEFGVWGDPGQQTRSFFYFRKLPYQAMDERSRAEYSDEHAARAKWLKPEERAAAADRWRRLQGLKARLQVDPGTASRCRGYEVGWDPVKKEITGLDAPDTGLVTKVVADLLPALEAEAREHLARVEAGQVPSELELFVAERTRGFVGRQTLLGRLVTEAVAPGQAEVRGVCLTGSSGSGKSAVFARLHQELSGKDLWLLSHAAGIGPTSGWVDTMLTDWIAELVTKLGVPNPLAAKAADGSRLAEARKPPLEEVFADLLRRASGEKRVVILIDALDRFERTNRGRYLTWLPRAWPANVRFLATTIAGDESQVLAKRPDTWVEELPPLDRSESKALAEGVYARYHRSPNQDAVAVLLDKATADGRPAAGIPLWLVSAVEELNLLDREDFLRADREFRDLAQDAQLPALVMAMVTDETPADLAELLAKTLERAERSYGKALTRAFATLLALGRSGWRERDLAVLVPAVVPLLFPEGAPAGWEGWSPLAFAALRRGFRAHLARRGDEDRWDFFHLQMRNAAGRAGLLDAGLCRRLHRAIVDHLLSLAPNDPLRVSEAMHHLIELADHARTARYMGGLAPNSAEMVGAASTLAHAIASGQLAGEGVRAWVLGCLAGGSLDELGLVAEFLLFEVDDNLAFSAQAEVDRGLALEAVHEVLQKVTSGYVPLRCIRLLSVARNKLGDHCLSSGGGGANERALSFYQDSRAVAEFLRDEDPQSLQAASDLAVVLSKLGELQHLQLGDRASALGCFRKAHDLSTWLVERSPDDLEFARTLGLSLDHLGQVYRDRAEPGDDELALQCFRQFHEIAVRIQHQTPHDPDAARSVSLALFRLSDFELGRGNLQAAIVQREQIHGNAEWVQRENPDSALATRDLAVECGSLANLLVRRGMPADVERATRLYRQAHEIAERLHQRMPHDRYATKTLAISLEDLAEFSLRRGNLEDALGFREKSREIAKTIWQENPDDTSAAHDLCVALNNLGELYHRRRKSHDPQRALACWQQSHEIASRLHQRDPSDTTAMRYLSSSSEHLGDFYLARDEGRDDVDTAIELYRTSCGIRRQVLDRIPHDADRVRELTMAFIRLSDAYVRRGREDDVMEAEVCCVDSLELVRRQHARAPDDSRASRYLCLCLNRLGNIYLDRGDQRALGLYQEWLEIAQHVFGQDPDDAEAARSVSNALFRVGKALGEQEAGAAKPHLSAALATIETLEGKGCHLFESDRHTLLWLRQVVRREAVDADLVGSSAPEELRAERDRDHFLSGLSLAEKVGVSNLNPLIYNVIIQEKRGEAAPDLMLPSGEACLSVLRRLTLGDLQELRSSVQAGLEGETAAKSGDMDQAARCYERAITINPHSDMALMSYGCVLASLGQLQKGVRWVEEAVRINPANEQAARNLRAIRRDL